MPFLGALAVKPNHHLDLDHRHLAKRHGASGLGAGAYMVAEEGKARENLRGKLVRAFRLRDDRSGGTVPEGDPMTLHRALAHYSILRINTIGLLPAFVALLCACDDGIIQCTGEVERSVDAGFCTVAFNDCEDDIEYRLECVGDPATCVCIEDGVRREDDTFFSDESPCAIDDEEDLERMVELGCGWPIEA